MGGERRRPQEKESGMRYMALIYSEPIGDVEPTPEEIQAVMDAYLAFGKEADDAGVRLGGEALQGVETATTVRVRNGERLVSDGPFAETKEVLGGYYLLECADLDEALDWAAKIPGASTGSVEVRPIMTFD
jgi:hypothetical protein